MYQGKLVRLREYRREDAERALSFVNNPEVSRMIATGSPFPFTLADEEKWVGEQSARKESYNFAIETLEDKLYIGGCGINRLDWKNRSATIGIMIGDPNYWGKGYGSDALRVLLGFIFLQMGLHRVDLIVFGYNGRAKRCYEKVGFTLEGTLRQSLYRDGAFHDEYLMSILRAEYDAMAGSGE